MDEPLVDLEAVTLELEEETIQAVDEKAFTDHRGNREAALRDLLDEWLKAREEED
jgi:ATP-dependent protease Clp ATPase subunit